MTQWHLKSKRKSSGGILNTQRRSDKRLVWKGNDPAHTTVAHSKDSKVEISHVTGGNTKQKLKNARYAQVSEAKSGKVTQYEVLDVVKNDANRQYARRNIITQGAIIKVKNKDTERYAKVTSRPGQSGMVNVILVEGDFSPKAKEKASKKAKPIEKDKEEVKLQKEEEKEPEESETS